MLKLGQTAKAAGEQCRMVAPLCSTADPWVAAGGEARTHGMVRHRNRKDCAILIFM